MAPIVPLVTRLATVTDGHMQGRNEGAQFSMSRITTARSFRVNHINLSRKAEKQRKF